MLYETINPASRFSFSETGQIVGPAHYMETWFNSNALIEGVKQLVEYAHAEHTYRQLALVWLNTDYAIYFSERNKCV